MPSGFSSYGQRAGKTVAERLAFYSRPSESGCRLWCGAKTLGGYGKVWAGGRHMLAHRAAWAAKNGPIPPGMRVLHNCPSGDNPACINVDHLWLGTARDNTQDMIAKGRQARLCGMRSARAKLTDEAVKAIRMDPRRQAVIAAEFGVHPAHISKIKSRAARPHTP